MKLQYYLNTESTEPLTERIIDLIRNAKTYIKTGNFFFREPKIKEELINACRRGVVLFIISNLRDGGERLPAGNKFAKEEYDPHLPNLYDLVEEGAHVRCIAELHAKFLLIDGNYGMIMSSNYTVNSLHGNPECGVDLSECDTKYLERVFDAIFTHADIKLVSRNKDGYRFKHNTNPISQEIFENNNTNIVMTLAAIKDEAGQTIETNFKMCAITELYDKIADIINDAEKFVFLAAFSFRELKKIPIIREAIINAEKRKVSVNIFFNNEQKTSFDEIKELREEAPKINAAGINNNHAKFLITDNYGFIFTANIDGKAGLLSGFELGVKLDDLQYSQAKEGIKILFSTNIN